MKQFIIWSFLIIGFSLGTVWSIPLDEPEDSVVNENDDESRILNGEKAGLKQYPFQISVQKKVGTTSSSKFCGGVIIRNKWILSAAHCLDGLSAVVQSGNLYINAGILDAYDRGKTSQYVKVEKTFPFKTYNADTLVDDIALFRLERSLKFDNHVSAIALPKSSYKVEIGSKGKIMGWGTVDKHETVFSQYLLAANTTVSDPGECHKKIGDLLTDKQICVGSNDNNNGCYGDSGGPFVQYIGGIPHVIGVVSYGKDTCEAKDPLVFTKVTSYLNWIEKTIKENS